MWKHLNTFTFLYFQSYEISLTVKIELQSNNFIGLAAKLLTVDTFWFFIFQNIATCKAHIALFLKNQNNFKNEIYSLASMKTLI